VEVASAGPDASLHLAPDKKSCQHPTTQFFYRPDPFQPPNQQCQSIDGYLSMYQIKTLTLSGISKQWLSVGLYQMCNDEFFSPQRQCKYNTKHTAYMCSTKQKYQK